MTAVTEPNEAEERFIPSGLEIDYYNILYPYRFQVTDPDKHAVPNVFIPDVHDWCCEQWGAPAARRFSQSRNGWRVREDSVWAYFKNIFYFKEAEHCVIFQLRWR